MLHYLVMKVSPGLHNDNFGLQPTLTSANQDSYIKNI